MLNIFERPSTANKKEDIDRIEKSYIPMNEVVAKLSKSHIEQENYYLLSHNVNKILFLMDVAKNSIDFVCRYYYFFLIESVQPIKSH